MNIQQISVQEVYNLQDIANIIDVREMNEYMEGHIPNVSLYPLSEIEQLDLDSLDPSRPLIVQCRSGGRSQQYIQYLQNQGYTGILYNLDGGIMAWIEAGYDIVSE